MTLVMINCSPRWLPCQAGCVVKGRWRWSKRLAVWYRWERISRDCSFQPDLRLLLQPTGSWVTAIQRIRNRKRTRPPGMIESESFYCKSSMSSLQCREPCFQNIVTTFLVNLVIGFQWLFTLLHNNSLSHPLPQYQPQLNGKLHAHTPPETISQSHHWAANVFY